MDAIHISCARNQEFRIALCFLLSFFNSNISVIHLPSLIWALRFIALFELDNCVAVESYALNVLTISTFHAAV